MNPFINVESGKCGTQLCLWSVVKNLPAMQEMRVQFLGQEDPLEKEIATLSNILTWKIPWTEESCRLQSPWGCKESDITEHAGYMPRSGITGSYVDHLLLMLLIIWFGSLVICFSLLHLFCLPFPPLLPSFRFITYFLFCFLCGL